MSIGSIHLCLDCEVRLTNGSTGAAEASFLTFFECYAAARSTGALGACGFQENEII
jgi:hypothetical protein